jgi:hypothetical protein
MAIKAFFYLSGTTSNSSKPTTTKSSTTSTRLRKILSSRPFAMLTLGAALGAHIVDWAFSVHMLARFPYLQEANPLGLSVWALLITVAVVYLPILCVAILSRSNIWLCPVAIVLSLVALISSLSAIIGNIQVYQLCS